MNRPRQKGVDIDTYKSLQRQSCSEAAMSSMGPDMDEALFIVDIFFCFVVCFLCFNFCFSHNGYARIL